MLSINVCFKEKTITTCPVPTESIAISKARFFLQIISTANDAALD